MAARLIARRYAQCRGTDTVLRSLAHLLATHSRATPKQVKEPILATEQNQVQIWENDFILGI